MNTSAPSQIPDLWSSLDTWEKRAKFLFDVLRKSAPLVQIVLALIALGVGLLFGYRWVRTEGNLGTLLISVLGAKGELVAQPYTGLETYLLSGFDAGKTASVPSEISDVIARIRDQIKPGRETRAQLDLTAVLLRPSGQLRAHSQFVTMRDDANAFLFVPGLLMPRKAGSMISPAQLKTLINSDQLLGYDIRAASKLSRNLREFDGKEISGRPVIQSYLMSESGVLLIRRSGINSHQGSYYEAALPAHRFFPERAYFWPTIETPASAGDFDSVSSVYVDTGGNGPVQTYCKKLNDDPAYIICLDAGVDAQAARSALTTRLGALETAPVPIRCQVTETSQDCNFVGSAPAGKDSEALQWLDERIGEAKAKGSLAEVFGSVAIRACQNGCTPENIEFTIPFRSNISGGTRIVDLYWAQANLQKVRLESAVDAGLSVGGLSICFLLVYFLGVDYRLKVRQQRAVLEDVALVMENAKTPFAWTDDRNCFVRANNEFISLLGYADFDDLRMRPNGTKRPFVDLMTQASKREYGDILLASQRGEETGKYDVDMVTKSGETLRVSIIGETVPFPGFTFRSLPHRFGVFLNWKTVAPA